MANISNDTGRAFEYLIVNKLLNFLNSRKKRAYLSQRGINSNFKDKSYFEGLNEDLKSSLKYGADAFLLWVDRQGWFNNQFNVDLDRIPDGAGIEGDPTDIRILIKDSKLSAIKNISVKHNHNALKHPRLPNLPHQCGLNDPVIRREFNSKMDLVWQRFLSRAKDLYPNSTKFNELKLKDKNFINENIYSPLIKIVCLFLNKHVNNPENSEKFFNFLTGNFNFYTIKNSQNYILIKHFIDLKKPKSFKIKYPFNSATTFLMDFDNGWKLTFRLHTASTNYLKNDKLTPNTKFDVICINLEDVIKIDKIDK